jgi:nitrogen-specific signal transduction histidine kinase
VLVVLLAPLGAVLALAHDGTLPDTAAAARAIFLGTAALAAAGLLQVHGRLAANDHSQWLSMVLGTFALAALTHGGYALTHPGDARRHATTVLAVMICMTVTLVGLLVLAARSRPAVNLLVVGVPLGALFLVAQQVAVTSGPALDTGLVPGLSVLLGALFGALAIALLRLAALPDWARARFGLAVALVACSVLAGAQLHPQPVRAGVALALGVVAGIVLATTAGALLRLVVAEEQDHLSDLRGRLADLEAAQRADLARLHEINTLVAGIASASRLVRELPPSADRDRLQRMVEAELDRLQRLLADRSGRAANGEPAAAGTAPGRVDLAELLQRIALVHRARGHGVTVLPTQLQVPGDADAVAEVLDALIENAALHGSREHITVAVRRVANGVEIAVSDRGPGVTPGLEDSLFRWGAHRPGSPGRGIGLYAADARARRLGGTLRLEDSPSGARFVLHLPDTPQEAGARGRLAVAAG